MLSNQTILKTYWSYAWAYKRYVLLLLITTPSANLLLRFLPPLIIAGIIDRLTNADYVYGEVWSSFQNEIILFSLAVLGGGFLLWRIVIYLVWKLEGFVIRDMSRDLFNKFTELDMTYHANSFGGSLVSRTTKLTNSYIRLQDGFIFQIYLMVVAYIFISFVMWNKSAAFVVAMWVFSLLFIAFSMLITKKVRTLTALEANAQNKVTGHLADAITNILTIKSFSGANFERSRFNKATENLRHKTVSVMWATLFRDSYTSFITSLISIAAIIIAIVAVVNYDADISIVFLIFAYTADISERLWQFSAQFLKQYNRAIGDSMEGMQTLLRKPLVADPANPEPSRITDGHIVFKDVVFDHDGNGKNNKVLFEKLNLDIKPGEKIGLVGRSGGGKTTITKLLLRFMDIQDGEITIDGQNIATITQDSLRESISYVPQEPLLFHRSLSENIGYGSKSSSEDDILNAARNAHADEFIKNLPKAYKTLVGERGVKLSGGQRQRVAIARAMLKKAPILVLDEATSALDSESEKLIQDALWKLMQNKTAIVIAHRLSTIQKLDRIIVLDNGKIIEQGSHDELIENKGVYSQLWDHQSGGFIEE